MIGLSSGPRRRRSHARERSARSGATRGLWQSFGVTASLITELRFQREGSRRRALELVRGKRWNNEWELIFTSTIGTPLNPEQFSKTVPKIFERAGRGHWPIHELRHSCASLLIAMEFPLEVVSEQMGHASIRVTNDVYGHLMPRARAKVAEAMRSVLFDEIIHARPLASTGLATQVATSDVADDYSEPANRAFVGRPGLDPGTLGLKGGCIRSEWSGGVGFIRESKKICPAVSDSSGGVGMVTGWNVGFFNSVQTFP